MQATHSSEVRPELNPYLRSVREPDVATDYLARCPGCGTVAPYVGNTGCLEDWNGESYRFKCCGHRAHLDPTLGGAETWIAAPRLQLEQRQRLSALAS